MIRRLGLILFGVLLALAGVEVVLRWSVVVPEGDNPLYHFHHSDPYLGWAGKPNVRMRYRRPEFNTLVELDAGGWRRPLPSPPDAARRILVLGDSFTWGWGVSQGELFTDRLQARLPTVALVNRGLFGFGTAQEYLLLQRELAAAHYDAVVLMFFVNDVADNIDGKDGHRPYFDLVDGRLQPRNQPALPYTSAPPSFLRRNSRAYELLTMELSLMRPRLRGVAGDERTYRESSVTDFHDLPGYAVTVRLLAEMAGLTRQHGAQFFLVYIPDRSEFEAASPYPYVHAVHAMVDDVARQERIPLVDLSPAFRRQAKAGLIFPVDAHWTPAGHQVAADVLLSSPIFAPSRVERDNGRESTDEVKGPRSRGASSAVGVEP